MNKFKLTALGATLALAFISNVDASGFQLFEQDAAGIGTYHAGAAAEANRASTEWYNPAGMTRLKHQEISAGLTVVHTRIPFTGRVLNDGLNPPADDQKVTAEGGGMNYIPNLHYVLPLGDSYAFGVGFVVPFGLETDYGSDTALRYAGTKTSVQAIDITPAIAYKVDQNLSVGLGFDFVRVDGVFDQYAGLLDSTLDTTSVNKGHDESFGYHIGILMQTSPDTRFGVTYHSSLHNHMNGTSTFSGPLATQNYQQTPKENFNLTSHFTLPAYLTFGAFHHFNAKWDGMFSATLTQWGVFQDLKLENVVTTVPSTTVVVHEGYQDTWNFALGANYHLNQKWLLRFGTGYDTTPSNDTDRNIQLPDSNRFMLATGARYMFNQHFWLDAGYMHLFMKTAPINVSQTVEPETVITRGDVNGSADVFGLQASWRFA